MPTEIALIAHDSRKVDMVGFVKRHHDLFSRYDLIATGTTGQRIQEGTGLTVTRMASGPLGGDTQIAARVVTGDVAAVFFLLDPLYAQPHEPDIRALLRICEVYDVPLATNLATAEAIVTHLQPMQVGHLIFNPAAGQGDPDQDLALIRRLLAPKLQLRVVVTSSDIDPADQVHGAIAAGTDLILASGGDGTVSAIAAAVLETDIPLGVIPRGTANAFASALGIPTDIQGACNTILAGTTRVVDAARCNGQPFVLLAGIGFEADMVKRATRDLKNRLGVLAYLLAGVQQFHAQTAFATTIEIDGELTEVESSAITIANAAPGSSLLAQGFGQVIPDDGLLEVTIATPKTRFQGINTFTSLFAAALINAPTNQEDILCLRTARLTITTDPPQRVVVDGELIGTTPVELEVVPNALRVFAPLSSAIAAIAQSEP